MTDTGGDPLPQELHELRHVVVVFADGVSVEDHPELVGQATDCPAYDASAPVEERRAVWTAYADRLVEAGYRVDLGGGVAATRSGQGADVTLIEVGASDLGTLLEATLAERRPDTLVALALGGSGNLLLVSPWSPGGWVSEESCDHTSPIQLCERWTASRGRAVLAELPPTSRALAGDLVGALTFRPAPRELTGQLEGRRLTRPVPYFPVARVELDGKVRLQLANVGPTATAPVALTVDDGTATRHEVAPSSVDEPAWVDVPVSVRDGRYDVRVVGPDHFRRRFAGTFPSPVRCDCAHFAGGDPWFPDLLLTVSHLTTVPVFFWLERGTGTRYGGVRNERLLGPRRSATFHEEPGARNHGWYDLRVTTSADPVWVQEYAGHLHAGNRPSLTQAT